MFKKKILIINLRKNYETYNEIKIENIEHKQQYMFKFGKKHMAKQHL